LLIRGTTKKIDKKLGVPATACELLLVKKAALRRGIWYRALSRAERGVLDLTAKYVKYIRSSKLANLVTGLIEKLQIASQSTLDKLTRSVGLLLAQKISDVAVGLGNRSAASWAVDLEFAKFLAVTNLNKR
jgi:hypothetical protein